MGQTLLFPDPKPLDRRLGRKFFRRAPHRTGVYLMKDASDKVLYVGKARDLKQRLNNYRLANPDRMPRRHLRMVREVAHIDFQFCANETAALKLEAKLLRSLKPRFNRAGVWPGKARFITWRITDGRLELRVVETPETGWHRFGPLNGSARSVLQSLLRLLWLALHPEASVAELPFGWGQGRIPDQAILSCREQTASLGAGLEKFFWEDPEEFLAWLGSRLDARTHSFERTVIDADMEQLRNFSQNTATLSRSRRQLALL